jgi:hypothetical protein
LNTDCACCRLVRTRVWGGSTDRIWESSAAVDTPGRAATSIWSSRPMRPNSLCAVGRAKIASVSPASDAELP